MGGGEWLRVNLVINFGYSLALAKPNNMLDLAMQLVILILTGINHQHYVYKHTRFYFINYL
jgi:hypothetical protein